MFTSVLCMDVCLVTVTSCRPGTALPPDGGIRIGVGLPSFTTEGQAPVYRVPSSLTAKANVPQVEEFADGTDRCCHVEITKRGSLVATTPSRPERLTAHGADRQPDSHTERGLAGQRVTWFYSNNLGETVSEQDDIGWGEALLPCRPSNDKRHQGRIAYQQPIRQQIDWSASSSKRQPNRERTLLTDTLSHLDTPPDSEPDSQPANQMTS
ncbi:unnamed protein product [Protopolystoma xenopodis]|uniref:Uncharacterized protein n=1 Tax=Protopolystoma xenopodis TaxID=117903 RepID=A0A3S5B176_9PLAT|nr:unnamed protein product [Protopolystoma xenopodis]